MAVAMVAGEFLCPPALNDRWPRVRLLLIGSLFIMQLSLAVFLKTLPSFPWLGACFFFVPWETLWCKLRGQRRKEGR